MQSGTSAVYVTLGVDENMGLYGGMTGTRRPLALRFIIVFLALSVVLLLLGLPPLETWLYVGAYMLSGIWCLFYLLTGERQQCATMGSRQGGYWIEKA